MLARSGVDPDDVDAKFCAMPVILCRRIVVRRTWFSILDAMDSLFSEVAAPQSGVAKM